MEQSEFDDDGEFEDPEFNGSESEDPEVLEESVDPLTKTAQHIRRMWASNQLEANPDNPNEMTDAQFNMLYDNIQKMGITDPILCVPHPTKPCSPETGEGFLRIIGGEHRWEVSKLFHMEQIPVTIVVDPGFTEDQQKFQVVRHNIIHGQMSPQKFMRMYQSLNQKYTEEVLAESFGFVDEEEFRRLIRSTAASLPPEMQQDFLEAAKEVKTIEGLSKILNRLFSTYGDTLPYGYMIFDFGGKDSVWLRMLEKKTLKTFMQIGKRCMQGQVSLDALMTEVMDQMISGKIDVDQLMEGLPKVQIPESVQLPTLDSMEFN